MPLEKIIQKEKIIKSVDAWVTHVEHDVLNAPSLVAHFRFYDTNTGSINPSSGKKRKTGDVNRIYNKFYLTEVKGKGPQVNDLPEWRERQFATYLEPYLNSNLKRRLRRAVHQKDAGLIIEGLTAYIKDAQHNIFSPKSLQEFFRSYDKETGKTISKSQGGKSGYLHRVHGQWYTKYRHEQTFEEYILGHADKKLKKSYDDVLRLPYEKAAEMYIIYVNNDISKAKSLKAFLVFSDPTTGRIASPKFKNKGKMRRIYYDWIRHHREISFETYLLQHLPKVLQGRLIESLESIGNVYSRKSLERIRSHR